MNRKGEIMRINLNTDNGIEITSVDEYMKEISKLNEQKTDVNAQLFFRGQAVEHWDIKPSIFRDNMLSVEHYLMSEPLRQVPDAFINLGDSFEIMEKYQHYGMCTRLLDVTTNPLVALYFACERHSEEDYKNPDSDEIERRCPQGIVYFKEVSMPLKYNDLSVKVISKLASYDLNDDTTINMVVQNLYEDGIISEDQRKRWGDEKGALEFVNLCQGVCTVLPIMNNDRLIRQSGAFLLPGKFNFFLRGDTMQGATISKAECNLREEFDKTFFYIADENKEAIRIELEHCNISEANLFPELEYQLRYIRKHNETQRRMVAYFEKFQLSQVDKKEEVQGDIVYNKNIVREIVKMKIVDDVLTDDIVEIFDKNQTVDWMRRDSILSKMKVLICKKLIKNAYSRQEAENIANGIMREVIEKHKAR